MQNFSFFVNLEYNAQNELLEQAKKVSMPSGMTLFSKERPVKRYFFDQRRHKCGAGMVEDVPFKKLDRKLSGWLYEKKSTR